MTESTAPAGADNPIEKKACRICKAEKEARPDLWPHRRGREGFYLAYGAVCLSCEKKRKATYEERRKALATGVAAATPVPAKGTTDDKQRKALKSANKLDIAQALKAGSIAMNQVAPGVMARIMEYLEDPEHRHHLWALELLAQRILPRKLYEELGGQAAGVGALQDRRPMFVLNVLPAQPGGQQGNVYDQEGNAQIVSLPVPAGESDGE